MSDLATLIAQLSGSHQQPASDPALAVVKLTRASLDALVLKLGQTIDARVVGQLAAGLTQLAAGSETFVLKLATPVPTGTAVTIRVAATPQGNPAVTVSVPAAPPQAAPMPVPAPAPPLLPAQAPQPAAPAPASPQPLPQATPPPLTPPPGTPARQPRPAAPASAPPAQLAPVPQAHVSAAQIRPASPPLPPAPPATSAPPPTAAALPAALPSATAPTPGQPAAPVSPPVAASPQVPAPGASRTVPPPAIQPPPAPVPAPPPGTPLPAPPAAAAAPPPANTAPATPTAATAVATSVQTAGKPASTAPPAPIPTPPLTAQPQQPLPTHPSPYPVHAPRAASPVVAQQLPLPATPKLAAAPLNLADPAQAAARQDSVAPLLARLAAIVTAAAPSLPRPVLEAGQRLLANRIDLNRAAPDGKAVEAAVLKAGVLAPLTREASADGKSALLALRSTLLAVLGGDAEASVTPVVRPAPPIRGEPPRAPAPHVAIPEPAAEGHETARTLLGHTDAALSRLKLLQSASQPAEIRADAPVPRHELRVEIPMLLGAQTGILQLMVERDGRHRRNPERQRGWRMRFAMNFSETGEVGADIALLGRSASIAIWAADSATADALDEMLPELAPAIQRHGLELTSLRVRRGLPQQARSAPGRLLDSAR